jgi:hypothetical protein
MKYSLLFTLFIVAASALGAQSSNPDKYYVFLSGQISALIKDEYVRVESFDGKSLSFASKAKSAKPSNKQPCSMKPIVAISNKYAEVSDMEFSFRSLAATLRADRAMAEMQAEQMRFEAGQDFENSDLGTSAAVETSNNTSPEELDNLTYNQIIDVIDGIDSVGVQDTITGRCAITSAQHLENAFVAVVLSFEEAKAQKRLQGIRRSVVRLFPIGDIPANESKKVKFTGYFAERTIRDAKLDLFFYDGKGDAIATNISRAIKEITPEQLEKFRKLEEAESAG